MDERQNIPARWTIKDVLEWTAGYFGKKGITTARLDAEVLLAYCLGVDRLHLYLNLDRPLRHEERVRYRELIRRRAMREPVALIRGVKEFWSLSLRATPGVLIPRPDTETLVEAVLEEIRERSSPNILEIGTGSGAVAVSVALENRDARIIATDIDTLALEAARFNAENLGVSASIDFLASDLFDAVRDGSKFDVVCCNPPYIPSDVIPTLEPEINFEPRKALDGGPDGLSVIRQLVSQARHYMADRGALIIEIGSEQEAWVCEMFETLGGLHDVHAFSDLSGKPRVVSGRL
ncbi:MAG: peptide chain release factor N(5)-glutamine methyltransferase [Desulfomonilaceae bacterium]